MKYLLSLNKINLDAVDKNKRTVLFYACDDVGNLDLFQLLSKSHKFDYDDQDEEGKTIFHHACEINSYDLVISIISLGAITTIKDHNGATLLHYACQSGNLDIVDFLINRDEFNKNEKDNELSSTETSSTSRQ